MKCQKMKKYLYHGLSVFMGLYLSLCSCIGSYASDSTSSGNTSPTVSQVLNNGNIYDVFSYVARRYASFPDYIGGSPITSWSYDAYADWLEDKGLLNYLDEPVTIINESSGGRGYDIPRDVRQSMVDYVNEVYIQQNPLTYTECYLRSYTGMNVDWLGSYEVYKSIQDAIKSSGGYGLICAGGNVAYNNWCYLITIPKQTYEIAFCGSTSNGNFSSVQLIHGWSIVTSLPIGSNGVRLYTFQPNSASSFHEVSSWNDTNARRELACQNVYNNNSYSQANGYTGYYTIFTSNEKPELVYVFNTINAYKNYNAGTGQNYYLPTGSTLTVPTSDIFTDDDLTRAGSYYNSIVDNSKSGWTAEQVLALVDKVLLASGGGSGSSGSDNDSSGLWNRIGDAIGNLIDGIINVLTTVIEHLSDALLSVIHLLTGYTDENGVVHEGLFGNLLNLVNSGFNNFLASIFSWLPEEIVTLFTAVLVFGIFFGLLKMLRR